MLAELATEFSLDLLELDGRQVDTRPAIDLRLVADDLATKRLREATNWLTEIALEELDDRRREVQLVRAFQNILLRNTILHHPLRKVANNLGRGGDLDDVSALRWI